MPISALFFDLDDTLCDDTGSVATALEATGRFAVDQLELSDWQRLIQIYTRVSDALWADFDSWGLGLSRLDARRYVWRLALLSGGYPTDEPFVHSVASYYNDQRNCHRWLPQARETLLELRSTYRLGLITNGSADMQRDKIRGLDLEGLFDMTVVAEELGHSKPRPEIFVHAMQRLAVTAAQSIMIGNSPEADIVGGHNAGMRTVWVCPVTKPWPLSSAPPWKTIRSVFELPLHLQSPRTR